MEWININDQMPKYGEQVLAVAKYQSCTESFIEIVSWEKWLNDEDDWAEWSGNKIDDDDYKVFYWMPLPKLPEIKK